MVVFIGVPVSLHKSIFMDLRPGNQTTVLDREGSSWHCPVAAEGRTPVHDFRSRDRQRSATMAYYELARPKRFELLIPRFVGWQEIFFYEISIMRTFFV
jgi:hypothetical protein